MKKAGTKIDIIKIYLAENWKSFLVVSVLSALARIFEVFGIIAFLPILAKETDIPLPDFIKDHIVDLSTLQILGVIGSLFLLKAIVLTIVTFIKAQIFSDYEKRFVYDFFNSTVQSKWKYFISKPVGEINNTALKECTAAAMIYSHITMLFSGILQLMILAFFSLYISWEATLFGIFGGVLILKGFDFMPKKLKILGERFQISFKETSGLVNDFFSNIKPLKSMNKDQALFDEIRPKLADQAILRRDLAFLKGSTSIIMEPIIILFICIVLYFTLEVIKMSFAETFVLIIIFYQLMTSWKTLNQSILAIAQYESFFWAVDEEITKTQEQKEITTGDIDHDFTNTIIFKNIGFEYDKDVSILSGLSFGIPKNQLTAIVGPSGSGKTTTIDLLCKLHEPTHGDIWVDDVNLHDINTSHWRSQIGYVPQEFFMLNNTLRHNITLGDAQYSDENINAALEKAGASAFMSSLEDGLNTVVGEKGVRFSGGQRQRISVARALLRNPKILILDEATTALDPETENAICQELKKLTHYTTVIAISHQSAILGVADNVIKLTNKK